ncbi:MAG: hypothetical protein AAB426_02745 [Myxococcota bacterium]
MTRIVDSPKVTLPLSPLDAPLTKPTATAATATEPKLASSTAKATIDAGALHLAPPQVSSARLESAQVDGARSFAGQIQSLGAQPLDNDNLIAQYLRLQILDMSANQAIQEMLFEAKGNLTQAAFNLERAMRSDYDNIDNLRKQAGDLENQAQSESDAALAALQGTAADGTEGTGTAAAGGEKPVDMQRMESDLWLAAYESLVVALTDAGAAQQTGDSEAAAERGARAAIILQGMGFPSDEKTVRELAALAQQSIAAGGNGSDVLERYFRAHPEALAGVVSSADAQRILTKGLTTADIVNIIKTQRAAHPVAGEDASGQFAALEYIDESVAKPLLERYQREYPEAMARAMPHLTSAASLYQQALDLHSRASLVLAGYWDATRTISEARTADNTHGVMDRNLRRQEELLSSIEALLSGRSTEKVREARLELQLHRADVARLTLALIDRHTSIGAAKSHSRLA